MLLSVQNLSKTYGDTPILNQVNLTLAAGQKQGLVGANGVGKSTLLRIIMGEIQMGEIQMGEIQMGEIEADSGHVQLGAGRRVGYLPQVLRDSAATTVQELIAFNLGELTRMEERMHQLEIAMSEGGPDLDARIAEYGRLSEQFERAGGYDLDYRIQTVLDGLEVAHIPQERPLSTLSGGEKSRVGLAALLLAAPDLLLLDEPTNHLDFRALGWLETYLHDFPGGLLVVSHDRHFLNRTVSGIIELVEHSKEAKHYTGSYDDYARRKAQERAQWEADYWAQQEEIRELRRAIKSKARQVAHNRPPSDGDKFLAAFKAGRVEDTIRRNVRAAEERLRRIEADPIPKPPRPMAINPEFDPAALASRTALTASDLHKEYAGTMVLDGVSVDIQPDSRVVIVGPNGAGKSTLLRILAGVETPDQGDVSVAPTARLGYLDQEQETLVQEGTLFESFCAGRTGDFEVFKAELMGYGLFTYPDLGKAVSALSVGQKRKLQLARLLTQRANLLLLDEPTNHISLDVLEEFEAALDAFRGPIVAISHDRRFIQRFAREIWELENGKLRRHLGGWDAYCDHHRLDTSEMRPSGA